MLVSLLLHYFHRMLAQGYFVHPASGNGDKTRYLPHIANRVPSRQ
jgi:hypothetical protein